MTNLQLTSQFNCKFNININGERSPSIGLISSHSYINRENHLYISTKKFNTDRTDLFNVCLVPLWEVRDGVLHYLESQMDSGRVRWFQNINFGKK